MSRLRTWKGQRRPRRFALVMLVAFAAVVASVVPARGGPEPAYVTLLFGRTQWAAAPGCQSAPAGALTLMQVAQRMQQKDLAGVGAVIMANAGGTNDGTGRLCSGGIRYANWADLAVLRDTYGWTFVSDGLTRSDLYAMTFAQRHGESCGTIMPFWERGHDRANGLFAYGDPTPGRQSIPPDMVKDQVSTCFAFTRRYEKTARNVRSQMGWPWYQKTKSISGGMCNDTTLPCSSTQLSTSRRYDSPEELAAYVDVLPDEWAALQAYRLVEGARTGTSGPQWDCTSDDWRQHWTSQEELYCWRDYEYVLDRVPSTAVVTDPLTVAERWRRLP